MKKFSGIYLDKKTGKYYVSTTFITKDGFEIKKCKRGFDTQRDADKWKQETKIYYASIEYDNEQLKKTPTELMCDEYFKAYKIKNKISSYYVMVETIKKHFIPYFKTEKLNELSPQAIQRYYNYISNLDLKTRSKNNLITKVLGLIDWLDLMEMIEPSISRKFKRILVKFENLEACKNDFYTIDEIKQLIASCKGDTLLDKQEKLFYQLCCYSGLRLGEAIAININDFDFDKKTVRISRQEQEYHKQTIVNYTKTNSIKVVDIPNSILESVKSVYDELGKEYLLLNLRREKLRKLFNKRIAENGFKKIKIHDLRHSYCTMLYELNADEKYVAKQMGHATPRTSRLTYEHLTNKTIESNKNNIINEIDNI